MKITSLVFLAILGNLMFHSPLFALEANFEQIRKRAEQGHPSAQYSLANSFFHGNGVAKNNAEALVWYKKAAEQGYIFAQYNLGVIYQTGNGATKNYAKALDCYIRPIKPEDADLFVELFKTLSATSVYYRFFSHVKELSPEMLAALTQIDYDRHMALVDLKCYLPYSALRFCRFLFCLG